MPAGTRRGKTKIWWLLAASSLLQVLGKIHDFFEKRKLDEPEVNMNIRQIITYWGYPNEEYEVVTDDGYVLGLNRIPYGKNNSKKGPWPVVYLQHGLLSSASTWILNLPNNSLAFMLADAGYDVWMGNSRGNTRSMKNIHISPDSSEFWTFSFDEMAKYDLPATIDFILEMTGQEQLYYVGYSQGSTIAFIAFSTDQALARKIKILFAFSPIATMKYMESPINKFSVFPEKIFKILLGDKIFYSDTFMEKIISTRICGHRLFDQICGNALFYIFGYNQKNLNMSRVDIYLSHTSGTSIQNMMHWNQAVKNGQFQAYDWGSPDQNMMHYNQTTPPLYKAEDMKVPVALWSGGNDFFTSPKDVDNLLHKLPNLIYHKRIPSYNHLDFTWGMDVSQQIYNEVIQMMKQNV